MSRSNVKQAVPFFWVRDIEKSIHFYVDCLGFNKTKEWMVEGRIQWCWLECGDAAIMLQEFWKDAQQTKSHGHKLGDGVSIAFICDDALSLYLQFISRGVLAAEPFVGNNMWVVGVSDPDGYNLFFESLTDIPEETRYSQWRRAK
jgi:lactoylglutathione lyase